MRAVRAVPDDLDLFLDEDAADYVGMGSPSSLWVFKGPDWPVDAGRNRLEWRDVRNRASSDVACP